MCGTCSRARERSLAPSLRRQGAPEPAPLRDELHLLGKPNLKPHDKIKVGKANQIYANAVFLLQICFELNCIVSIENPARSWLWPLLAMLVKETGRTDFIQWYFSLVSTMFDACMHGSTRDKSTTILGSPGVFESLGIRCDKSHSHQAWSATKTIHQGWVFDTAAEAEYPALLSQRMAACIVRHIPPHCLDVQRNNLRMTSLQVQGRQHKALKQLIPDFASFFWAKLPSTPAKNEKCLPPKTAGEENEVENQCNEEQNSDEMTKVGVFLEPADHLELALQLKHPMDTTAKLPDLLKKAIFKMLTTEPSDLAKERLEMLKLYRRRAEELQQAEHELHKSLPDHVREVVQGKRILLLEERLKATAFPDLQVVEDFKHGVDLVGEEPFSPLFLEKLQPASMTVEQLEATAAMNRSLAMARPLTEHEQPHANRLVEKKKSTSGFCRAPTFLNMRSLKSLGPLLGPLQRDFCCCRGRT